MKTVNELSRITGLSKRAIRYYDQINLLKPEAVSDSGYRLYGDKSLEMLQQILIFRELNISLSYIKSILNNKHLGKLKLLKNLKKLLILKRNHLNDLISLIDKIISGDGKMSFDEFNINKIAQTIKNNTEFLKNYDKDMYNNIHNKDKDFDKETIEFIKEYPETIKIMYGSLENLNEILKNAPERIKKYNDIKNQIDEIDKQLGKSQNKEISSPEVQNLIHQLDKLIVKMSGGAGFKQLKKLKSFNEEKLKSINERELKELQKKAEEHKKDLELVSKTHNNTYGEGAYEFRCKAIQYYIENLK